MKRRLIFENYKYSLFNNKTISKSQQRIKSDCHNVYTEEINKITLISYGDKWLQTFDRVKTYLYETNAIKVCQSEMLIVRDFFIKNYEDFLFYCNKDNKKFKILMINFDDYTNENKKQHNSKLLYIPVHPYRLLIIRGSGSGKTNALLNLIENQPDIDKIYLYAKDHYEVKYQWLINIREKVGLKHYDDSKAFIEYSNDMQYVYKNIDEYNTVKERKILMIFDDMIANMMNNKKLNSIVIESFIRGRKLNIYLAFITQPYFKVSKDVRLNTADFFIMKIPDKREL